MIRKIFTAIIAMLPAVVYAQEIGANFNHDPEIIDLACLKKTPVEWIRTTPYIFQYIQGEKDPATEPGLQKVIDARKAGYKVAFADTSAWLCGGEKVFCNSYCHTGSCRCLHRYV